MFLTGRGSLPSREEALFFLFKSLVLRGQFPQHILQDSAIQEIFQFIGSIYAAERLVGFRLAIGAVDDNVDRLARLQTRYVLDREGLFTGKAQHLAIHVLHELQGTGTQARRAWWREKG